MVSNNELYIARIVYSTSTDGVGLRNSLYVSGCPIHCAECHNKQWWDIKSGEKQTVDSVFSHLNSDQFDISILGGEPLMQYEPILNLCKMIKENTDKTIWLWSGYTLEWIKLHYPEILSYIDVLVDGPFVSKLSLPNLQWRGSTNQRIWKVKNVNEIFDITEKLSDM